MREFTFLIPTKRDSDGHYHGPIPFSWLNANLVEHFGGYTRVTQGVHGAWRDDSGETVYDESYEYRVALNAGRRRQEDYAKLMGIIEACKNTFDQQCIYLAETSTNAQLV